MKRRFRQTGHAGSPSNRSLKRDSISSLLDRLSGGGQMTNLHLSPTMLRRLNAVIVAVRTGLPSPDEVDGFADWLDSGLLIVTKEDCAEAEAAVRRFQQAYDTARSLEYAMIVGITCGPAAILDFLEAMVSESKAAKELMKLNAAGKLFVQGDRHD